MTRAAQEWEARLMRGGNTEKARVAQRFFRTGKGEYGEGDVFLGYTVPEVRALAREAMALSRADLASLLTSVWHEVRMLALVVLTKQAARLKRKSERDDLARWVLEHRAGINNWDLVDISIPILIGGVEPTAVWVRRMKTLLRSPRLWDRRIAMLTTFGWMRQGILDPLWEFAAACLRDPEDLMHKATGWMLREGGKRDLDGLKRFLEVHRLKMPRTMLRYAIERFPEKERQRYLAKTALEE